MPDITPPTGADSRYLELVEKQTGKGLPKVVDATGDYVTRNGLRVSIFEIKDEKTSTFNCKGCVFRKRKNGRITSEYGIWQPNGRHLAVGEDSLDILKKASNEKN
jgi:hypothetical protein